MINKDQGGGDNFKILLGEHSCYEGGHRAHGGSPQSPTRENPVGGCSVHRGDIMIDVGDTMSTSGDFQYIRGIP